MHWLVVKQLALFLFYNTLHLAIYFGIPLTGEERRKGEREGNAHTDGIPKTAGIPCNWETLLFTPRYHHLSSDKTEHIFHHISTDLKQTKENIQMHKVHSRSVNIFQHFSWVQYDSRYFINIKYDCWWMSLMQIKSMLNIEIISHYLARMLFSNL